MTSNGCPHLRTLGRVDLSRPDGVQVRSVLAQPKRLALLIYLAAATPRGFHRKDTLLALFWPESPDGHARRALNRAVYFLRQSLGRDVLIGRGDEEIAVAGDLWCDVVAFERAVEAGRLEEALELYQGDFAPGFFVSGLPELERWMDSERTRLRGRAAAAALRLAEREEMRDELSLAAHWLHRAATLAPHDEAVARQRIDLLSRAGDRTGALEAYQELAARLRDDLEVEPSSETRALEQAVRRRPDATGSALPVGDAPAPPAPSIVAAPAPAPRVERRRGSLAWVAGGALIAAGAAAAVAMAHGRDAVLTLGHRTAVAVATEFERWPALSPDGGTVFYTRSSLAGDELVAQEVQGGRPLPLTATLSGSQRYGALSPDGKLLLFRQDDGLYLMPALGGEPRRVVPAKVVFHHPGFQELAGAWAPDSRHIAYAELDTLFTQTVGEAGRTAISSGVAVHSPAWSSDGRWIAFVEGNPDFHVRGNLAFSAVRIVPAHGGETMAITDASALNTSPVWIPGRRSLLFISDRDGGRDIYQVAVARNGAPRNAAVRITTGLNPERLAISADGRRIAWSVLTETSNIRSLDVAVAESIPLSRARPITTGSQLVEAVGGVSPDGAWLYYHGTRSGVTDLWRTPLAGSGDPERLTFDSAMSFAPAVSPDGREIAFHSLRTGNRDIFVMPAAGGPAVLVSDSPDQEGVPAWSPDGRALIWLSGDTVRMAKRGADGAWGPYRSVLRTCGCGGWAQWSPDGRWISWPGLSGLELFDPSTGQRRLLGGGAGTTWHVWSRDGRTVFAVNIAGREGVRLMSISVPDGRRRILGYADNPTGQGERYGLAEHDGRLYFPLVERNADVWVADLGGS